MRRPFRSTSDTILSCREVSNGSTARGEYRVALWMRLPRWSRCRRLNRRFPGLNRGLRDHGAGRVSRHVGHEHDLRDDRPAGDRHGGDARAGDGACARIARRADPRAGRLRGRKGENGHFPQRARFRGASGQDDRRAAPGPGQSGRGLRRHVLRSRPAGWIGVVPRRGPARSTARRAGPARARRWPPCTPRANCR